MPNGKVKRNITSLIIVLGLGMLTVCQSSNAVETPAISGKFLTVAVLNVLRATKHG